jgi:hypothetical protein
MRNLGREEESLQMKTKLIYARLPFLYAAPFTLAPAIPSNQIGQLQYMELPTPVESVGSAWIIGI